MNATEIHRRALVRAARALELRRQGLTFREIGNEMSVAEKLYTAPWSNEIDEAEARRRMALPKDHPLFTDFRHKWGCIYRYGAVPDSAPACACLRDS